MKRVFVLLVVVALFGVVACGGEAQEPTAVPPTAIAAVVVSTETATAEPTPTAEPTAEPTATTAPTATAEPTAAPTETPIPEPTATATKPAPTREAPTATPAKDEPTRVAEATPIVKEEVEEEDDVLIEESAAPVTVDLAELDVVALMQTAEANAKAQETIIIEQNITTLLPGVSQSQSQTCYLETETGWQYCLTVSSAVVEGMGDPISSTNEIVYRDETLWVRVDDGDWEELPVDFLETAGFESFDQLNNIGLSEFVASAEATRQIRLNGIEAYEIQFELDVESYYNAIVNEEMADQIFSLFAEYSGGGTIWLAVEEELVQRMTLQVVFTGDEGELIATTKATYRFNEPITIPNPAEE